MAYSINASHRFLYFCLISPLIYFHTDVVNSGLNDEANVEMADLPNEVGGGGGRGREMGGW